MTARWEADYTRTYLMPPALEDWIGRDDPVRFVRMFVDRFSRREWRLEEPSIKGRPAYDERVLLKIWLFGYLRGIHSCRALERACGELVPMMWLAGELRPDHNTLWRFWAKHQETIGQVYELTLEAAAEASLIGLELHAVDGSKIQSCASTHRVTSKGDLEALRERVRQKRREIEQKIEQQHEVEQDEPEATRLDEELQDRKRLEKRIDELLDKIDPKRRHNPSEPEARLMKGCGLGYNAQAVVDAKAELIVARAVVTEENDNNQLIPMLDQVHERFGTTAEQSLADGGYNTQEALAEAEDKGYEVVVGTAAREPKNPEEKPYHASRFDYDELRDVMICPAGRELTFERTAKRKTTLVRVFRGRQCATCPVRTNCTRDRRGRSIDLWPHHMAAVRQRKKRHDPFIRQLYKRRLPLAERPFAYIKHLLGFRRFKARGLANAVLEWTLICGIYNMTRLAPIWQG